MMTGPLNVALAFYFRRPKSHYRTGKNKYMLKDNAPEQHVSTPDLDNLVKFVCDSYNNHFYKDDSQIVEIRAEKHYIEINDFPRTEVMIDGN